MIIKEGLSIDYKVSSPCIGVCSTGIGDTVCRGCKRFAHEIIHWNGYCDAERQSIDQRLQTLLVQVIQAKLKVVDANQLQQALAGQNIKVNRHADPYCWVFALLKAGASQIQDLSAFGCALMPAYAGYKLSELRGLIDQDFYVLSSVHYERYFSPITT